jgi:hypothetical protein
VKLTVRVVILMFFLCSSVDSIARAGEVDLVANGSSAKRYTSSTSEYLLLLAFSLDLSKPNVGPDANVLSYSFRGGFAASNILFLFAHHYASGTFDTGYPLAEYRSDNSFLVGYIKHFESLLVYGVAGPGLVDYSIRGDHKPGADAGIFEQKAGQSIGGSVSIAAYYTPVSWWGAVGIGLYASVFHSQAYWLVELSLVELTIPF